MATLNRTGLPFNPVSWGTLFFIFWLTLITIPEVGTVLMVIAWIFFGFSCILWLAIYTPLFDKYIGAERTQQRIIPWVIIISLFVLMISSLTALGSTPESLRIIVSIGMVTWSFAYMTIMLWNIKGVRVGFIASGLFIVIGVFRLFQTVHPIEPWTLIAMGVGLCLITIFKSKIGRKFPSM